MISRRAQCLRSNAPWLLPLLALLAAPVWDGAQVQAVTDLNLRAGPGPQHEIIGVISADGSVDLEGCLEEGNWCKVDMNVRTAGPMVNT